MNTSIQNFYAGTGTDNRGRTLEDILDWDDTRLENSHDYIQWLFPTVERSAYNQSAPVLTTEDIAEFLSNLQLQHQLRRSFERILNFYGLKLSENTELTKVVPSHTFSEKTQGWVTRRNHNFLRITRILKCLTLLGMVEYAEAFLDELVKIAKNERDVVGSETLTYWRQALT